MALTRQISFKWGVKISSDTFMNNDVEAHIWSMWKLHSRELIFMTYSLRQGKQFFDNLRLNFLLFLSLVTRSLDLHRPPPFLCLKQCLIFLILVEAEQILKKLRNKKFELWLISLVLHVSHQNTFFFHFLLYFNSSCSLLSHLANIFIN